MYKKNVLLYEASVITSQKMGYLIYKNLHIALFFFPFEIITTVVNIGENLVFRVNCQLDTLTLKYFNVCFLQVGTFLPHNHNTTIKTEKLTLLH